MEKLLSIIVPSYNMEALLPACCASFVVSDASLLQQIEVLVVNDGSTDNTLSVVQRFAAQYPSTFRVIDKPNGNYGSCVNRGLQEATGRFVRVVDADDQVDTKGLEELVRTLGALADDIDLVLTDYETIDLQGQRNGRHAYRLPDGAFTLDAIDTNQVRCDLHALTYRRSVFDRFSYHQSEGISYTDTEWLTVPMAFVRQATYLPIVVTLYLVGREGQTMEPRIYARRFGQVVQIVERLISEFESISARAENTSKKYYAHLVAYAINMVFSARIFGVGSGVRVDVNLEELDALIKKCSPTLFVETEQFRAPSNHFPLRVMHAYRRWRTIYDPAILAFKFYMFICKRFVR